MDTVSEQYMHHRVIGFSETSYSVCSLLSNCDAICTAKDADIRDTLGLNLLLHRSDTSML